MRLKANQTLTVTARCRWEPAIVLRAIDRTAETVVGAVDAPAAAAAIVAAAGAADVLVAAEGIADVAGQAGEGTKFFAADLHGFTRITKGEPRPFALAYL